VAVAHVTIGEGMHAAAGRLGVPPVTIAGPIVDAAARALRQTCGQKATKGRIYLIRSQRTNGEVSALIAVTGGRVGLVTYSMTRETARVIASAIIGKLCEEFDELAQSAIAELANIITGRAARRCNARASRTACRADALLFMGDGTSFTTFNLTRLVVPLVLDSGEFNIDMGIKGT
jgi:chemotaxis protein CheX